MTPDATRPVDGRGHAHLHGHSHSHTHSPGPGHNRTSMSELDLLAGLWEEARFARLPWDAPSELRELVEDIDNPKRVHSIHKASRRHNFQQLVQLYIEQLREGCTAEHCSTPTCFNCRRRAVGRAPIRRYNTTSARTLATYLASQDNPEKNLCPNLKPVKIAPAAVNTLVFAPKPPLRDDRAPGVPAKGHAPASRGGSPKTAGSVNGPQPNPPRPRDGRLDGNSTEPPRPASPLKQGDAKKYPRRPNFTITEEPVSKDYRSFAANVFGTVAFKMLEWLTPSAMEDLHMQAQAFQTKPADQAPDVASSNSNSKSGTNTTSSRPKTVQESPVLSADPSGNPTKSQKISRHGNNGKEIRDRIDQSDKEARLEQQQQPQPQPHREPLPAPRSGPQRRNSNAKVRTPKPKRQLSIDPFASDPSSDDPFAGLLISPRTNGGPTDRSARGLKSTSSALSRPISQLSSAGFFDDVTLEKMPAPKLVDFKLKPGRGQLDGARNSETSNQDDSAASGVPSNRSASNSSAQGLDPESESEDDSLLPQTLSRLNAEVVDFICDIIQEDGTAEKHMLEPPLITRFHTRFSGQPKPLKRRPRSSRTYPSDVRLEWKLFVEQTLFYVLSDPQLAVQSFSTQGQLYDSQTLWYCMLRMTRIAPSLVFHSLWMAAASLFAPPKTLQSLRSPTGKLFPKHETPLSNAEAGRLMSICLHALVAAAPVTDSQELSDMSRIRSHGLSLAGSGSVAQQPVALCLQYEDAFADDLALRLARRLFAAITTRRYYDEINNSNLISDEDKEPDVLTPLFSQLDFLNMDAVYILNFSFLDRALHEARVPTLLLDWARAVMLRDWGGNPEVPGDGSFGGALALIQAMYKKRHELLLSDNQFRSEYFADRLDTVQMPVSWLSHTQTRQKLHLLDFPYIFNPETLVSYFRSINFSRMSRAFEESTSLQEKMEVIASRSSLTMHHKEVLMERLKTAAAKYLILDIRRDNVVKDTFNQLWRREERELLRPLKVHLGELDGEEGFDSGGVQQEFFRMVIAEILNPDYGAFTLDERTRMAWFVPGSLEPEWKFELVGLLVSLAVYNGLTLPVTFPRALYRKLLGEPVTELHHIEDGWPDLASGLTTLLEWDESQGLVEDVFARTYEFSVSVFGEHVTREMKAPSQATRASASDAAAPENWPQFPKNTWGAPDTPAPQLGNPDEDEAPLVTHDNRNAYVSDYIRYLTDVSVRPQYEAFERGFRMCLHPKSLGLLNSNILHSIIEGVQEIDISELKRYTRYVGWDASHRTIKDFWSIVRRYDDGMKRKLLEFVTASDRVPVGGVKNMMFILQKNGAVDDPSGHLPTSYTCYGTLLLPEYKDKEILRQRLAMALENAQGFGFA
ncbi:hypothetical protein B0H63DRAFT_556045 [Podospora didyma]|uniref:HECT-type E3 ubiquitin transferase n=1 Tax=Podospora didyma TaxID=330526 RepID=A0AAE0P7U7_9PEZI|nr:hypothetical protein B0H63DRAFT_556045 [Podospora didyma]